MVGGMKKKIVKEIETLEFLIHKNVDLKQNNL